MTCDVRRTGISEKSMLREIANDEQNLIMI